MSLIWLKMIRYFFHHQMMKEMEDKCSEWPSNVHDRWDMGTGPHIMNVSEPWISFIFNKTKKVELRKNDQNNWGRMKKGDVLKIYKKETGQHQFFEVRETRTYANLDDAIIAEGVRHLLPGKKTLEEARDVYLSFDGENKRSEREAEYNKYGVIVIELMSLILYL